MYDEGVIHLKSGLRSKNEVRKSDEIRHKNGQRISAHIVHSVNLQ